MSSAAQMQAFGLSALSAASAPLGACCVLFMRRGVSSLKLPFSIALAAGVMLFVSLVEVVGSSMKDLERSGMSFVVAESVAFLAFFGGIGSCFLLDIVTDGILRWATREGNAATHAVAVSAAGTPLHQQQQQQQQQQLQPGPGGKDAGAAPALDAAVTLRIVTPPSNMPLVRHGGGSSEGSSASSSAGADADAVIVDGDFAEAAEALAHCSEEHDRVHLLRTGVLIGLALSLHNLPEGLATYVGFMSSPKLGLSIALAICIHNIPEGIAVGVPVYWATGSRLKAIGFAAVSGLAEPLGALIGLVVQATGNLDPLAMGIIMSLVAGVMSGVALKELVPRALQYDPANRVATNGVFAGMALMAASLLLLNLVSEGGGA